MSRKPSIPDPPEHLSDESKAWWREIVEAYILEPQHLKLLQLAAESWDRCCQARAEIDKHGVVFEDRFGSLKPNPACAVERDAKISFTRLVRELCLDDSAPEASRPPRSGGRGSR